MTVPPRHQSIEDARFRVFVMESLTRIEAKEQQLFRLVKAFLPFGQGRPRRDDVTRAAEVFAKEAQRATCWDTSAIRKAWRKIYGVCLPPRASYDSEDAFRKAKRSLRNAVKLRTARDEARRAKQSPGTGNVPSHRATKTV